MVEDAVKRGWYSHVNGGLDYLGERIESPLFDRFIDFMDRNGKFIRGRNFTLAGEYVMDYVCDGVYVETRDACRDDGRGHNTIRAIKMSAESEEDIDSLAERIGLSLNGSDQR